MVMMPYLSNGATLAKLIIELKLLVSFFECLVIHRVQDGGNRKTDRQTDKLTNTIKGVNFS